MPQHPQIIRQKRITVSHWDDHRIFGVDAAGGGVAVLNPQLIPTCYLYADAQLNLLLSEVQPDGSLLPQHLVLDPDYLVDVTAICRCFTHHGDVPLMHLMQKFMPTTATAAILLGNAANQFLDDCVNAPADIDDASLYRISLRKTFAGDPLRFATTDGIDQQFSGQCRALFRNIRATVRDRLSVPATLESAFICEAMGIQGRMDMMTTDHRTIVELKSGKADERGGHINFRYEHAMQMALYKESLYYNEGLPYAQVSTLLFYARYPELLDIHLGRNDIHRAVHVRNGIVHLERQLCRQPGVLLHNLSEADFNVKGCHDRFYEQYLRPHILKFLQGLHTGPELVQRYFYAMLTFVEREQFLAKTGIEGVTLPAGHHGFADTWRADADTKLDAGRLIPDLRLTPILEADGVVALDAVTTHIDESSNFRVGDMVMLYPQRTGRPPAASYISCVIEWLTPTSLRLRLRYPQHDTSVFADAATLYAIEPAHADSGYTVLYRGLFDFLSTAKDRQQLLLGERAPRFDSSVALRVPIADTSLRDIVLRAKQAQDFFLLVGPPGTGKTSVALRQMVLEAAGDTLLLMAFTNRAVDEICTMLNGIGAIYLRLGPALSCAPEHRSHLLSAYTEGQATRNSIRELLSATPILVGTIASISGLPELFRLKHFNAAIIDEASQALEPHLLPLFCATDEHGHAAIDKFILIGDHKQLPAVVVQSPSDSAVHDDALNAIGLTDCRRSMFERLHDLALRQHVPDVIGLLHRQGRMHEDIAAYVNRQYYEGQLALVPLPHQTGPLSHPILSTRRMIGIDIPASPECCTAKSNGSEAHEVAHLAAVLADGLIQADEPLDWPHRLGVIVPFRGQITLVRRALSAAGVPEAERITIDTVERYQGSQRDIIIFSTTVSAAWQLPILSQPVQAGHQLLDRKLNVAITRARQQFILVGDFALLRTCPPYRDLLETLSIMQKTHYPLAD